MMANHPNPTPWIAYRKPRPRARIRLFCLPYAGGAASVFRGWADQLPEEIDVCPVQLPGREGRIREEPFLDSDEAVAALDEALAEELARGPHALFGHSMGAVLGFELARRRKAKGLPEPVHLFVSGRSAPTEPDLEEPIHDLPPDRFRERLRKLNGTPVEVLDHPELMQLVEPLLRSDFQVVETYEYRPGETLTCPITALGGTEDDHVPTDHLDAWSEMTRGAFRKRVLPGDHFFLNGPSRTEILRIIARTLLG